MEIMQHVGLDVHKKTIYAVVLDNKGDLVFKEQIANEPKHFNKFLVKIDKNANIALESCICWEHVYDHLDHAGFKNINLANPSRIGLIAKSDKKTDEYDAKILANLVRTNLLPLSYAPSKEIRQQRRITRYRASLACIQNTIKNRVHAILIREGIQNPYENIFTNEGLEYLKTLELEWADSFQMENYIRLITHINIQKKKAEQLIAEYVENNPSAKLLCSIPGIATYSALIIIAEIGDIRRFKTARQLVSYAGLNPRVSQSGDKCYVGRISKQGDKHLRWILNQCANIAIKHDSNLAKIYHRLKKRKNHNQAITAIARKMLTYIFTMLENQIKYQQLQSYKKAS
jgi:transposase